MENIQQNSTKEKIKLDFKEANYATGKRKTSIAKIWLKKGSGKILVNGKIMMIISKEPTTRCNY